MPPRKINGQAKDTIAMAFADLGDVEGLVKWARSGARNRAAFYQNVYTKLIPVTVSGTVDGKDESSSAMQKLEDAFLRIMATRGDGDGPTVNAAGFISNVPYSRSIAGEPRAEPAATEGAGPAPSEGPEVPPDDGTGLRQPRCPGKEPSRGDDRDTERAPADVKPRAAFPPRTSSAPSVPGMYIGALENIETDQSTTARFYRWNGHGRY